MARSQTPRIFDSHMVNLLRVVYTPQLDIGYELTFSCNFVKNAANRLPQEALVLARILEQNVTRMKHVKVVLVSLVYAWLVLVPIEDCATMTEIARADFAAALRS